MKRQTFRYIRQAGIGLMELMISMLIGLFIMAGVVQLFSTTGQNAIASAGASRIQENARYVFARIAEDIAQSGNLGCLSTTYSASISDDLVENLLANETGPLEAYDFLTIIYGVESATAGELPVDSVAANTDTLHIRYVNNSFRIPLARKVERGDTTIQVDTGTDYDRLSDDDIVALSNCSQVAVFKITNRSETGAITFAAGGDPGTQQNIRNTFEMSPENFVDLRGSTIRLNGKSQAYLYGGTTGSHIYFIDTAAGAAGSCDSVTSPQNCALFRRSNGNDSEELVEGVHNMEVWFGWTSDAGNLFFSKADGVNDWTLIDRVKVRFDFNSIDNVVASGNTIDQTTAGLINRRVERTFNLANQL